jgi:hypothetical protein
VFRSPGQNPMALRRPKGSLYAKCKEESVVTFESKAMI